MNSYKREISSLEEILDVTFKDRTLPIEALTHSSYYGEKHIGRGSNERLEFLGDAIIGALIAETLFKSYPETPEGELSIYKSSLVSADTLSDIARKLGLQKLILLTTGEEKSGARDRNSILADLYEAVIAAVYLDCGYESCKAIVGKHFANYIAHANIIQKSPKMALQEETQKRFHLLPEYSSMQLSATPQGASFEATVAINGKLLASGIGRTKKEAESVAAAVALKKILNK